MIRNWLSHLRARRPSTIRRLDNRVRSRLQMDLLEDRTVPAVLDLTAAPSGFLNDGFFELIAQQPAGSGVIDSFVRLHDLGPGDTNTPEGHNTSGRNPGSPKLNFDENSSPVFTRNIRLQDVPLITIGTGKSAVSYREFRLDVNEPNKSSAVPVSLNKVKIFSSKTANVLATPTDISELGVLRWDMDGNTASAGPQSGPDQDSAAPSPNGNWVLINDVNHGSGQADMRLLVPNSAFNGVGSSDFIYFYSRFGDTRAMTGGYEEWYLGAPAKEQPVNVVTQIFRGTHPGNEVGGPIDGSPFVVPLASTVHDHAYVTDLAGNKITTGSVTFSFWNNIDCIGDPDMTWIDSDGSDGWTSGIKGPLHSGEYSFAASYSGVSGKFAGGTSECEPLIVPPGDLVLDTRVHNSSHADITGKHVSLGSVVHDNAFFIPGGPYLPGFEPAGKVTYEFWKDTNANGKNDAGDVKLTTQDVTLTAAGAIPESADTVALGAGSYYYLTRYASAKNASGFDDYPDATGPLEPFVVDKAQLNIRTDIHNAAHQIVANGSHVKLGSVMHDTATVTGQVVGFPIGAVTFTLNGNSVATVAPEAGSTARSADSAPLTAGDYKYQAAVAGNDNYIGATSDYEPFVVDKADVQIRTEVHNSAHQDITGQTIPTGTQVHDKAFVTGQVANIVIGGTVTYRFYRDTDGDGDGDTLISTQTVPVGQESSVITPDGGFWAYRATYNGDANYNGPAVSAWEPFSVLTSQPGHTPGWWQNQNGQALLTQADFTELNALNLVNADGSPRNFNGTLEQNKAALADWILSEATNMAYKLSSFLATITLNINHGFNDGSGLVYAPSLIANYPAAAALAEGPGGQFISLNNLLTLANNELGIHPIADSDDPWRPYQTALKDLLDSIANGAPIFLL